ncbi:hypothetical protein ET495_05370 [Xylanimonas allomyrinae]|uniref:Uncharacterized protein n=1 Tax=Xylanimonas allomyrinae TaxID=2509459 RepID=A0A4P6EJH4_9MICO|nr:hypothetical protein [Xylanimonas allomyrinae]QAY62780.1 hypothetical protein ET495_05370 [Xylanimonas allomyrinae]
MRRKDRDTGSPSISGDRMTWKVRRIASERRGDFGRLLHVEAARFGAGFWATGGLVWVAACAAALYGDLDRGVPVTLGSVASFALPFGVVVWIPLWLFAQYKLLVFERGLVVGGFVPGMRPMALPFHAVDAGTVRAARGIAQPRQVGRLLDPVVMSERGHEHTQFPFAFWTVSFLGPDPQVVRGAGKWRRATRLTPVVLGETTAGWLWVFTVVNEARLERLVRVLVEAMRAAGAAGVEGVEAVALPARRIAGSWADAEHLGIPVEQRIHGMPGDPRR